jgi:urocanate hydratase
MTARLVKAMRGPELRCKGWRQESILRMLENNLENGENPLDLVVYGGSFKAARDWDNYDLIQRALMVLEEDETLIVQSGKPVGIFKTTKDTPLVLMASGNTAGASDQEVEELLDKNLTIRPGMTAAAWQYIGSQGIIQGTYETFMAVARQHFEGTLDGRLVLTAGCGAMSGAQPLAGVLAGASILVAEVEHQRLNRRIDEGYLERSTDDIGEAIDLWLSAAENREAASIGVAANIVDVLDEIARRGIVPDVVTDQTTVDPLHGYVPVGLSADDCIRLRTDDPEGLTKLSNETIIRHAQHLIQLQRKGAVVFEYGNELRDQAFRNGVSDVFEIHGFIDLFIRPYFCEAIGPFRLTAIQGDPETIYRIDQLLIEMFSDIPRVTEWLEKAHKIKFTGLPARVCWLGHTERTRAALAINELIATGEIEGPIALSRDHLDAASVTFRTRESENMVDGSDCISDWPILNAMLDGVSGADLVAVHGSTRSLNAGPTTIADGTREASERIRRVMDADTGLGVLRQADAGFELALKARERFGLSLGERLSTFENLRKNRGIDEGEA